MIKLLRGHINRPIVLWVVFLLLLLFLIAKPGIGFPQSGQPGIIRFALLEIDGKTPGAVLVTERHFIVTKDTAIVNQYGKRIGLDDLLVPCVADVKYRLMMDKDPETLKIVVEKVFHNSSTVYVPRE